LFVQNTDVSNSQSGCEENRPLREKKLGNATLAHNVVVDWVCANYILLVFDLRKTYSEAHRHQI